MSDSSEEILGQITGSDLFDTMQTQKRAWQAEISILKQCLVEFEGDIFFEFSIPRMGRRIDVVLVVQHVIFVVEFKVEEKVFSNHAIDQVFDYALDLKNFHETSHDKVIAPILIATGAKDTFTKIEMTGHFDNLIGPINASPALLPKVIKSVLEFVDGDRIDPSYWANGRYVPTPTIIEAAMALYNSHTVKNIANIEKENLSLTTGIIADVIHNAKIKNEKVICFVTGVPGAGKTLVGLDIATKHLDKDTLETSVFLSGNGPLVAILRAALTNDKWQRDKEQGKKTKKGDISNEVKTFIQNVHHYRDEYLKDTQRPPVDHVAIFDEAQRAWNKEQTVNFMVRKKNQPNFSKSEPEFLISCLDRHNDWAVIVCLVGGGQEINTGEAGIGEWIESLNRSFPSWHIYISPELKESEYATGNVAGLLQERRNVFTNEHLHLSVSMRSFRAEHLSSLVKEILDLEILTAQKSFLKIKEKYPIVLTRHVDKAKAWLKKQARGSERYGIVVSSQAQRLKSLAINVKSPVDPVHWFLNGKDDVRSSFFLEDVATEFQVQGLELDWACVTWDADFRYSSKGWETYSFQGNKWQNIRKDEGKKYLKNAYRVLLTRARQGVVIVVPEGDFEDITRKNEFYDCTFNYLKQIGFEVLG